MMAKPKGASIGMSAETLEAFRSYKLAVEEKLELAPQSWDQFIQLLSNRRPMP